MSEPLLPQLSSLRRQTGGSGTSASAVLALASREKRAPGHRSAPHGGTHIGRVADCPIGENDTRRALRFRRSGSWANDDDKTSIGDPPRKTTGHRHRSAANRQPTTPEARQKGCA
jgi:hypothetical protein